MMVSQLGKESILKEEFPIESLLAARQLLDPQIDGDRIYFIGNLTGKYSLYVIEKTGSIPLPLLPDNIALQNPHLMAGDGLYYIFPNLGKILVMIDNNGDELYQPCLIPITGGIPKQIFSNYESQQLMLANANIMNDVVFFYVDDRKLPGYELIKVDLKTLEIFSFGKKPFGVFLLGVTQNMKKAIIADSDQAGDTVIYLWEEGRDPQLIYGKPFEEREPDEEVIPNGFNSAVFVENDTAILIVSMLFSDNYAVTWISLNDFSNIIDLPIDGLLHSGFGELTLFKHVRDNLFLIEYNIGGCSFVYEVKYVAKKEKRYLKVVKPLIGLENPVADGVLLGIGFDKVGIIKKEIQIREYITSFTNATLPSQLFLISHIENQSLTFDQLSQERVLGIPQEYLSGGEDVSYSSFDELRISARLYRPVEKLGYKGPRPLVVYIHGGPHSQERPDFTWFSMPLIQYLTLHGFTVFVPNVRGSSGYGYDYMSKVKKDWGGKDVLDHVEGLKVLESDPLIDSNNRFVTGRSYGGYMTLTLISRHPNKFKAGADLFGPYDLIGLYNRLPASWQVFIGKMMGDPQNNKELLIERSPKTYLDQIVAPLLVIQGKNDPRVLLEESEEIVHNLRKKGKKVELIVLKNEGHDVHKFHNQIRVYQEITRFFMNNIS